jgi:hypothetical protein
MNAMIPNRILGMICGYYLSKFDRAAYDRLGHHTLRATHEALGHALGVPPKSIKNWRDEFDPVHENDRAGWHRRDMYPSRLRVIEAFGELEEGELFSLIANFLARPESEEAAQMVGVIRDGGGPPERAEGYGLRGPTGAKAEEAFMAFHSRRQEPVAGQLIDRRNDQCGFDFEISGATSTALVEVKGLAGGTGGILLTDKEWATAMQNGDNYYIAIARQVADRQQVSLLRNPPGVLRPKLRTYTTVNVGWAVPHRDLSLAPFTAPVAVETSIAGYG